MRTRALFIVAKARQAAANAAAVQIAGPYAADTFSVPVCQGASTVVTHYAACWDMKDIELAAFKQAMASSIAGKTGRVFENAGRAKMLAEGFHP